MHWKKYNDIYVLKSKIIACKTKKDIITFNNYIYIYIILSISNDCIALKRYLRKILTLRIVI